MGGRFNIETVVFIGKGVYNNIIISSSHLEERKVATLQQVSQLSHLVNVCVNEKYLKTQYKSVHEIQPSDCSYCIQRD